MTTCPNCNHTMTCEQCDQPLAPGLIRFCSEDCRAENQDAKRRDLIEDITDLHRMGTPPSEIARRVGYSVATLCRLLYRYGQHDLARTFNQTREREQAKACPDCGQRISRGAARCRPCGYRARYGREKVA